MIEVHLYGSLRRVAADAAATSDSVVSLPHEDADTVMSVVSRAGLQADEIGSNLFLNGRYATLDTPVADGDRLGLFPDDMQLLYKWYFDPSPGTGEPEAGKGAEK